MHEVPDIGDIVSSDSKDEKTVEARECIEREISPVFDVQEYLWCIKCKGKVTGTSSDVIGSCAKCGTQVNLSKVQPSGFLFQLKMTVILPLQLSIFS